MMCLLCPTSSPHDYTVKNNPNKTEDRKLAIVCPGARRLELARQLSEATSAPISRTTGTGAQLELRLQDDVIELYDSELNTSIIVDFTGGTLAHRQQYGGGKGQAIAKAVGMKSGRVPSVLDVTAGLAGDAFVLASLGCPVTMIERSPVNAALINDAIERASLNSNFQHILDQGFTLINADANVYMQACRQAPDVIYIDPMYPERKKSALVKKEMQILQKLLHQETDAVSNESALLENALACAAKRVVVKRPLHAPTITDRKPSTTVSSKKTRYDIYTLNKM